MAKKIVFKIEGEPSDVLAAYRELHEAQRRTTRGAKEGGETGKRASGNIVAGIESQITRMVSYAAILAAARKAVQLIGDEWDNVRERARKAMELQIPATEAMNRAVLNLPLDWDVKEMEVWRSRVADKTKMPVARIGDLLQAVAAKGALEKEPALAGIEAVASLEQYLGTGAFSAEAMSGVLDIAKVTKARTSEDVMRALGWAVQIQRAARVTTFESLLGSAPGGIRAMTLAGFKPGEAAQFFTALTQVTGDPTGEQAATAMAKWSKEIADLVPEEVRGGGLRASMEWMQALPAAQRKKALKSFGGRGRAQLFVRALMKGDEGAWGELAAAEEAISEPLSTEAGGTLEQTLARFLQARGADTLAAKRGGERAVEKARLALPPAEQRAAVYREELPEFLQATGVSRIQRWIEELRFEFLNAVFGDPELAYRTVLDIQKLSAPGEKKSLLEDRMAELTEMMDHLVGATEANTAATEGRGAATMPAGE